MSPSKEEYSNLCLLLTLNKLTDHKDYKVLPSPMSSRSPNLSLLLQNWNPQRARLACFQQILPLVRDLLTGDKKEASPGAGATAGAGAGSVLAANDRLLQLIIKGALMLLCYVKPILEKIQSTIVLINNKNNLDLKDSSPPFAF